MTITYDGGDVDREGVTPYDGALVFGPEKFAEVDENWTDKVVEKQGTPDDERFTSADQLPTGLYERAKALVDAATIVEGCTVPWLAGRSRDGKEFYPDIALPVEVTDAKVRTRRSIAIHEMAELIRMNEGVTYDDGSDPPGTAHYDANGCEKIDVEAQGGTWEPYCLALRPLIKECDDCELLYNLPPLDRLDLRMYEDDDRAELERIDIADEDAEKSTFTSPSSATDGLSNYDLEGARARRKKRRKKPKAETPMTADALKLFIPITKIDAAKRLVYGVATAEQPDIAKEICDYATTKPLYQVWSEGFSKVTDGKSLGNLRVMHGNVAAGKLTDIAFNDDAKKIEICAKVVDDAEWNKVQEGVYTGFSQGGKYIKRWKDGDFTRYTAEPVEISLVDAPCLPEATFEIVKVDGSTEMRKFKAVETLKAPSAQDIAAKAQELAKAAGDETKWQDHIAAAELELTKVFLAISEPAAKLETPVDNEVGEQVWVNPRLPGKTFKKKADLRQALIDLDAQETATKTAKPVLDALKTITDALTTQGGDAGAGGKTDPVVKVDLPAGDGNILDKKDYSDDERAAMAKDGRALKDGSFPIDNKTDLENAVKAHGRSSNKAVAKRHIIKRAKALKATDLLPADWSGSTKDKGASKVAGDGDLQKGVWLCDVANMLSLLAQLESAEEVAGREEWGPFLNLSPELRASFRTLVSSMAELMAEMLDAVVDEIKGDDIMEQSARGLGMFKLAFLKAGAKHSKADKERISKAHDLLTELDPDCCPAEDDDDDDAEKLAKQLNAEREANAKLLSETIMPAIAKITEQLGKMDVTLKAVADQPLPMGTSSVLRVVEKTQDFGAMAEKIDSSAVGDDGLQRLAIATERVARQSGP